MGRYQGMQCSLVIKKLKQIMPNKSNTFCSAQVIYPSTSISSSRYSSALFLRILPVVSVSSIYNLFPPF